jgi:UDP-N-acetylmuramoyl-tripeptide--D-alanyl-D-alanine ligase
MEKIKVSEILKWCNGKPNKNFNDILIEGISTDTRNLKKGELFIALKGERFDGHDFVNEAFKKGAIGCIVSKNYKKEDGFLIRVKDTLFALGDICKNYREKINMHVIGITGSDGKTTTKEIVKEVLSTKYNTIGTIGNFNNQIGLPLSILQSDIKTEFGIFEMGMNKKGEIEYLSRISKPNSCIITTIGVAHIGFFKNRKEIAEAKSEIFNNLIGERNVFLNKDSDFYLYLKKKSKSNNIFSICVKRKGDIKGRIVQEGIDYFIFQVNNKKFKMNFWNPSFIYSALFGIAVGRKFGIPENYIEDVFIKIKPLKGRGELIKNKIFIIDESYNSNPNSLKNSLLCFERKKFKRKIVIIGDMAELGKFTNFYHWYIGKLLKRLNIDIVLTYGDKSKIISDYSKKGNHFCEIENLKKYLKNIIKRDDAILIKGSRIIKMEEIVDFLKEEI